MNVDTRREHETEPITDLTGFVLASHLIAAHGRMPSLIWSARESERLAAHRMAHNGAAEAWARGGDAGEEDTFPAHVCGNCLGDNDVRYCPEPDRRLCAGCRMVGTEWEEPTEPVPS